MPFDDAFLTELVQTARDVTSAFDRSVGLSPARVAILLERSRCGACTQADLQRRNKVHGASITRQVQPIQPLPRGKVDGATRTKGQSAHIDRATVRLIIM